MTEFIKTNFACRICGNENDNLEFSAREMLFGTKDTFKYIECSNCKCIQIKEIPENLSKYYPQSYNSFTNKIKLRDNTLKKYLKELLAKKYLNDERNLLSIYLQKRFGVGFLEKIKPTGVNLNSKILDVGSGDGLRLVGLARYGFKNITGIDPFLEKDLEYENGIKIFKKDVLNIDDTYDMIMLNHSFEHIINPEEVLEKINTLLKTNGSVLIRIPVSNSASWKKYGANWVALDPPRHIYLHNANTIKILSEKFGFKFSHVIYDSSEYQFVGSEQYLKDIPMFSENSFYKNPQKSIFSSEQIKQFKIDAEKLNCSNEGDAACFYLTKK
ncbi:MAG: class I SAM-dependent methyltransferase [Ignavibacteriae bacterium]|nr:class I SAM-dependent methyltransferase [Ignavibacteriota bacterium]